MLDLFFSSDNFAAMQLLILLILLLFIPKPARALYNGNPAFLQLPEEGVYFAKEAWLSLRLGYEGDFVFDRKMNKHVHRFKILENLGVATLGFSERVEVYGGLGSFSAKFHENNSGQQLVWKAGARVLVWQSGDTFLTAHLGYQQASSVYREIAGGVGIARKFDIFSPYIGVEASSAKAKIKKRSEINSSTLHSRTPVGFFFGCGLSPGTRVIVNVEARLIDEQAVTVSGDMRF
jgi:hypothetical protein